MAYGELGSYPTHISVKCKIIGYWLRLLSSEEPKLIPVINKALLRLYNENIHKFPWRISVENLLNDYGLSNELISKIFIQLIINGLHRQ